MVEDRWVYFSIDLMRRPGQEFARRLLAHDIFAAVRRCEEVGWVTLAVAELRDGVSSERQVVCFDMRDGISSPRISDRSAPA